MVEAPAAVSLVRCRELLGEEAAALSDEDVEALRQHAEAMAHVVIELFVELLRLPE
jgi:hypothetical protein